jgi:hypothetical protein
MGESNMTKLLFVFDHNKSKFNNFYFYRRSGTQLDFTFVGSDGVVTILSYRGTLS